MRILALITARGGSKRLPGKNIRQLGGKPLIVWSIDVVRDIPEICEILVSTDDEEIAKVCKRAGASVPWLRLAELSSDTANSIDVALHALDWYEAEMGKVDGVLLLQPTSPFRTQATIKKGIALFGRHGNKSVLGVSPTKSHPMWSMKLEGGYLKPFMEKLSFDIRSQDLPPVYVINGSFYLIAPKELRSSRSFISTQTIPLIIESWQDALDIDTDCDFKLAEVIVKSAHSY